MKHILLCSLLLFAIAMPAPAELTPQDLDKIRLIVKIEQLIHDQEQKIEALTQEIETLKQQRTVNP